MAEKMKADQFANYAIVTVTESAANTLTFKKLETGISLTEKVAWILSRVEYVPTTPSNAVFNGDGDSLYWGLALSSSFTTVGLTENTIIDYNQWTRLDFGTAATSNLLTRPVVKDFSSLPGGGILVPPNPLYLFAQGTGLASAATVIARMHYSLLPLSVDQYWELVEARRVLSS